MTDSRSILRAMWLSHAVLAAAAVLTVVTADIGAAARAVIAAVAALPLLAAIPGLRRRERRTYQWLTVVLVLYVGAAAVEVVATLGASVFGGVVLFAALVELVLLLRLIREPAARPATHRE